MTAILARRAARRILSSTSVAIVCCTFAAATQKKVLRPKPHQQAKVAAEPADFASSQPSPEIVKLAQTMAGRWITRENFQAGPQARHSGNGRGVDVIRSGPGGLSLVAEYSSHGPDGKFSGLGVLLWQQDLESYLLYWTDSLSPGMLLLRGNWQGDKLVFTGSTTSGANTIYLKQTYSNFTKNSFAFTEESAVQGGPLEKDLQVEFTRAGAAPRIPKNSKTK